MNPNEEQKSTARIALCDCAPGAELPDAEQHSNSCLSKSKIHFEQVASLLASREQQAFAIGAKHVRTEVELTAAQFEIDMAGYDDVEIKAARTGYQNCVKAARSAAAPFLNPKGE